MKGPTICRFSFGMARCTAKPSPKSRTRGTTMSSSASHDLLSPRIGSAEGIQLITKLRQLLAPGHDEITHLNLNSLIILIKRCRAQLDQSLVWSRSRWSDVEYFT